MDVTFVSSIPRNVVLCIAQIQILALWTKFLTLVFRMFSTTRFTSRQIRTPKVQVHSNQNFCVEMKALSKLLLNCLSEFLEIVASNILLHQILESWKMSNFGCLYCWKDLRCYHEWMATAEIKKKLWWHLISAHGLTNCSCKFWNLSQKVCFCPRRVKISFAGLFKPNDKYRWIFSLFSWKSCFWNQILTSSYVIILLDFLTLFVHNTVRSCWFFLFG